ncbi:hypothetical protein FHS27_001678 [Rhodopirellula rubra]|uniref:Uncharacterized protein n=1 Tax=Aporhodopirellula rubra TaxID=980271 RepID=A0A7W5DWK4_9BACT|nr:hypothetical protein [Aporhodopirellula rubra]
MVKPSLPHHGPINAGTMAPIVPPSQSMVPLVSDHQGRILQKKLAERQLFGSKTQKAEYWLTFTIGPILALAPAFKP